MNRGKTVLYVVVCLIVLVILSYIACCVPLTTVENFITLDQAEWFRLLFLKPTIETEVIDAPHLEAKPFSIYYTSKVHKCDNPGVYYIQNIKEESYKIDFSWDKTYYQKLYKVLRDQFTGVNKSPTPKQNGILVEIQSIIDQYSGFIDEGSTYCKHTIPNWYMFAPKDEEFYLGDISTNKFRGLPAHWAVVGKKVGDGDEQVKGVIPMTMKSDPSRRHFINVNNENQLYYVNKLIDYNKSTVEELYCKNIDDNSDNMQICLIVHPDDKKISYMFNGNTYDKHQLMENTSAFDSFVSKLIYQGQLNTENITKVKNSTRVATCTRRRKNICGTVKNIPTPITYVLFIDHDMSFDFLKTMLPLYFMLNTYEDLSRRYMTDKQEYKVGDKVRVRYNEEIYTQLKTLHSSVVSLLEQSLHYKNQYTYALLNVLYSIYVHSNNITQIVMDRTYMAFAYQLRQTIHQTIRNIVRNEWLKVTLSSSTTLVPEYYRHVSFDGNLYISLD